MEELILPLSLHIHTELQALLTYQTNLMHVAHLVLSESFLKITSSISDNF